jgi:sec-independent protein translocase protein TatC
MPIHDDELRLEKSKMSFGEHLEELRKALFKSIAALFVGFLVGMYFANDIIDYVQTPVRASLADFYMRQSVRQQQQHIEKLEEEGKTPADQELVTAEDLAREGLMMNEYLVAPDDMAALLRQYFPDMPPPEAAASQGETSNGATASNSEPPPRLKRERLMPLRVYQPIEDDPRLRVVGHSTTEPFAIWIRAALIAGLVFASPFIFYFIWEFVAAGLYRHEQSYVYTYLPISLGLFIGGALLAFFFAFEPLLDFMFWYYERTGTQPDLRLSEWISFVLMMPLGFGISFQLPLVMLLLERLGVFTVESYWRKWRAAVVVIAIIAMLLTPSADPYSMLLMGVPLVMLYFGGIWLCQYMPGGGNKGALAPA